MSRKSWQRMDRHTVTCRDCGKTGTSDRSDPAPGICPKCFQKRMDQVWIEQVAVGSFRGFFDRLIQIGGLTEEAACSYMIEIIRAATEPKARSRVDLN